MTTVHLCVFHILDSKIWNANLSFDAGQHCDRFIFMQIDILQINAFTGKAFSGNPAAVCPLKKFLPDNIMQSIATQNNLSETAFIVAGRNSYSIRWFSPTQEVKLCGHATLAAAYAVFNYLETELNGIQFESASGILKASRVGNDVELDFPARPIEEITLPSLIIEAINFVPQQVLGSDDYIVVLKDQKQITELKVDLNKLSLLDRRGVIFTAPGIEADFVSRVFHPKLGIGEDPVCGSAHCELMPYWSNVFNKTKLHAFQLSSRGGEIFCEIKNDRVFLKGKCQTYLKGIIFLDALPNA